MCLALLPLVMAGCEDALDTKSVNEFDEYDVWRNPDLAQGTLLTVYDAIPFRFDPYDGNFLDAATDNAVTNNYTSGVYRLANRGATRADNPIGDWSNSYTQIQTIHLFMKKGLGDGIQYDRVDEDLDLAYKERLKGECHFLRAWWYFNLLKLYGGRTDDGQALGIPMVFEYIEDDEQAIASRFSRETYEQCVKLIIADCDSAITYLPDAYNSNGNAALNQTQIGRATAWSARVLKSRVALYGASAAYQPASVVDIAGMGSFRVTDQAEYERKWEYAALVADTVIQTAGFGNFTPLTHGNIANNTGNTPADFVFRFYYNANGIEGRHFPPYYYGQAQTVPSQNLMEAFPSLNGYPITDSRSGYDKDDPYAMSRDNRFNLVMYYHGRTFGNSGEAVDIAYGGKDSPTFSPKATRTGYYLSKFLSNQANMLTPTASSNTGHYTPVLRKSEVFYNFAEASNEAYGPYGVGPGCLYSAYDVIRTIRAAYGITDTQYLNEVAADKDSFRALIQNERRLDFAFEDQRWFDMRRWLLPLDEPVRGVEVESVNGTEVYSYREVEQRPFDHVRYYYLPLPYSEVMKNPNLKNNLGWDNN